MPVIALLDTRPPDTMTDRLRAFRQGLKDVGYVEGENVAIEYRSAENQIDRLPALAAELVRRNVAVVAASGGPAPALAAKAATSTIPIVFVAAEDPVGLGLVASLARPGGNLTGVNILTAELAAKRLELLRELVPGAVRVAMFADPNIPAADITLRELDAAARTMGLQIQVLNASTSREIDAAFATFVRERPDALFVAGQAFFNSRRVQLALLAAFHRVPTTFGLREYVEAGGLMSYGPNIADAFRQLGVYAGPFHTRGEGACSTCGRLNRHGVRRSRLRRRQRCLSSAPRRRSSRRHPRSCRCRKQTRRQSESSPRGWRKR
jgi:putative ABC transport system substrate-binding protein